MSAIFRFGRQAAVAAAVAAAQPSGHARAPQPAAVASPAAAHALTKVYDQEWVAVGRDDEVLFQPFCEAEVEGALAHVAAASSLSGVASTTAICELTDTPGSGSVSPGCDANRVLEHETFVSRLQQARTAEQEKLDQLMLITSKLLKRPGMQAEIVRCMIDDPEVAQLLLGQGDGLDSYLSECGIHATRLLPPAAASATSEPRAACTITEVDGEEGEDPVHRAVRRVAALLERTSGVLHDVAAFLGGWLRDRASDMGNLLAGAFGVPMAETAAPSEACGESSPGADKPRPSRGHVLLRAALSMAVVALVLMLARNPAALRRVAVAAGTAAAVRKVSTP